MAKYIKSYSNYVLKTKHQNTSNGVVYERDMTTIGGKDSFSKGQVPVYKTSNFIITINNDNNIHKKNHVSDWYRSDAGEMWTSEVLKFYEKDEKTSYDRKIVIKNDFYDLRDYAYYGSCEELIRASISDILKTYPGELFVPYETIYVGGNGKVQYTQEAAEEAFGDAYDNVITGLYDYYKTFDNNRYGELYKELKEPTDEEIENLEKGIPYVRKYMRTYIDSDKKKHVDESLDLVIVDNPFGINIHDRFVPKGADPLKYFADGGVDNYVAYKIDPVEGWMIDTDHEYSIKILNIVYEGLGESAIENVNFDVDGGNCGGECTNDLITVAISAFSSSEVSGEVDITCLKPGTYLGYVELGFSKNTYQFYTEPTSKTERSDCEITKVNCNNNTDCLGLEGEEGASATILVQSNTSETIDDDDKLKVYMFVDNDYKIRYFVQNYSNKNKDDIKDKNFRFRIRPTRKIINDYFENKLDSFEKILLNRYSDPIYSATFEIIDENEFGYYTNLKTFTFPTTYGGYNLGSSSTLFVDYLNSLSKIGLFYDDRFSDNLWRSMTHEAIKNFDWTYTRHCTPGEEEPFVEGGTKIQKIIRLYGREFDEIKNFTNSISDNNTVTYDNVENLPDYFFTDKLDTEGWDLTPIKPLVLSEYVNGYELAPVDIDKMFCDKYFEDGKKGTTADAEKHNYFYDTEELDNKITIKRVFNQYLDNFKVKPYTKEQITNIRETTYTGVTGDSIGYSFDFPEADGENCVSSDRLEIGITTKVGEKVADGYHDACGNLIRLYTDENEYSPSDVNTEFFKRLIMNSRDLWKHKGTIDGMEMLLSLFGFRSKKNFYSNERYFKSAIVDNKCYLELTEAGKEYYVKHNGHLDRLYDYDIKEYTMFTNRIEDEWLPEKDMFKYDWINSIKLVSYNTPEFKNGEYISYQGLPVSYKNQTTITEDGEEVITGRTLYPHFETKGIYDGGMYYQMNGGWLQKRPFAFDLNNNIVPESENSNNRRSDALFAETVRNIKAVNSLTDLLTDASLATNAGDIVQVVNLSGRYAIVDGVVYPLVNEYNNVNEEEGQSYFYVSIKNNSVVIGKTYFDDYVVVSNPYMEKKKNRIDLNDNYNNNKALKIYVLEEVDEETGKKSYNIEAYSNKASISTFTLFENGKYMDGDNFTHYFKLNNPDFKSELSILGWQQLKDTDYEYYKINMIENYNLGNNPHYGHMNYDNGHEYLRFFNNLFRYTSEHDLIDYRKLEGDEYHLLDDYESFGFRNLIDAEDPCDINYDKYLRLDSKCHYFGSILQKENRNTATITNSEDTIEYISCFSKRTLTESEDGGYPITEIVRSNYIDDSATISYKSVAPIDIVEVNPSLSDGIFSMSTRSNVAPSRGGIAVTPGTGIGGVVNPIISPSDMASEKALAGTRVKIENVYYGDVNDKLLGEGGEYDRTIIDNVTDQILNTKRMDIDFFIKNTTEYSKEWLEEVKYIDSIILPYLTQMMPSGVICRINYKTVK